MLLPPAEAKQSTSWLLFSPCAFALAELLRRKVDLLKLRQLSTVFQMQVIAANRLLYAAEPAVAEEFEMLAFSFYQKLNDIINKVQSIQRCVFRAREEYNFNPAGLSFDFN